MIRQHPRQLVVALMPLPLVTEVVLLPAAKRPRVLQQLRNLQMQN